MKLLIAAALLTLAGCMPLGSGEGDAGPDADLLTVEMRTPDGGAAAIWGRVPSVGERSPDGAPRCGSLRVADLRCAPGAKAVRINAWIGCVLDEGATGYPPHEVIAGDYQQATSYYPHTTGRVDHTEDGIVAVLVQCVDTRLHPTVYPPRGWVMGDDYQILKMQCWDQWTGAAITCVPF